jgi:uroporphyrinogen-III synthase
MARLRASLGTPRLIATVVKRGYRLSVDPVADPGEKYGDGA